MRRMAKFLEIPAMPEDKFQAAVEHCTFDWMKEHVELVAPPQAEVAWENGVRTLRQGYQFPLEGRPL
jgi:aryl sulfotransferase